MRMLFFHGRHMNTKSHWVPEFLDHCRERGLEVIAPDLPNPGFPRLKEWLATAHSVLPDPSKDTIVIGTSQGAMTAMHYIASLEKPVGGLILLAPFPHSLVHPWFPNILMRNPDFKKVRANAKHISILQSANDPYVPVENGYFLQRVLDARLTVLPGGGHFVGSHGFSGLEDLLDLLDRTMVKMSGTRSSRKQHD
jgi:predicted alpha/beta hydrolase family esterase